MPIDRVFSKVGFGTIVTGTVLSGKIKSSIDLEVFPGNKITKVRGIQTHGKVHYQLKWVIGLQLT